MNTKSQEGYVLILTIIFILILTIGGMGLFSFVEHSGKGIKVQEVKYTNAYYASMAGLRYAGILLRDASIFGFTELGEAGDPANPETYTVTGTELGGNFLQDIGIAAGDLTITITEINAGPQQGQYELKAVSQY